MVSGKGPRDRGGTRRCRRSEVGIKRGATTAEGKVEKSNRKVEKSKPETRSGESRNAETTAFHVELWLVAHVIGGIDCLLLTSF